MTLAEKLKPHVAKILAAHEAGDHSATNIITLYKMYCSCPSDPAAPALCEAAFNDWMKGNLNAHSN